MRFDIFFLNSIIYSSNAAVCPRPTFSAAGNVMRRRAEPTPISRVKVGAGAPLQPRA